MLQKSPNVCVGLEREIELPAQNNLLNIERMKPLLRLKTKKVVDFFPIKFSSSSSSCYL